MANFYCQSLQTTNNSMLMATCVLLTTALLQQNLPHLRCRYLLQPFNLLLFLCILVVLLLSSSKSSYRFRPSVNVYIVLADMLRGKKKIEFSEKEQAYVPMCNSQASDPCVLEIVRGKWGQNINIFIFNGLQFVDEEGTIGTNLVAL